MYIIDLKTFKLPKDFPKKGELKRLLIQQTVDLHDEDIKEIIEDILYDEFRPYMASSDARDRVKEVGKQIIDIIEQKAKRKL